MTKKLITKKIRDLTETDKAQYLAYIKESFEEDYDMDWSLFEPHIQANIDTIFDDASFSDFVTTHSLKSPHSPRSSYSPRVEKVKMAMEARKYFNYRKPSLVDYLIFGAAFEKGTDEVSWWVQLPSTSSKSTSSSKTASTKTETAEKAAITETVNNASEGASEGTSSGRDRTGTAGSGTAGRKAAGKKRRIAVRASLSSEEKDLFYNTFFPLIDFVNKKYKIARNTNLFEEPDSISPSAAKKLTAKLWENPDKEISAYLDYLAKKKHRIKEAECAEHEEREVLLGWQRGVIRGRFIIERYLKSGAVFIHMTEENVGPVFIVKGLSASFEDMFWDKPLPLMIDATLLPFKGMIVTDGLFAPYGLIFGKSVRNAFKDVYMKAKKNKTVFTRL